MRDEVKSVLLVGVGGQGTILASKILTSGLITAGYDVKMSEVHGMSQRSGSVSTQVRCGRKVYSPIIGEGQADVLVAFETMEAIRALPYLKPDGIAVVNDFQMPSMPILSGEKEYPDNILEEIRSRVQTISLDAAALANACGNPRGMNVVLLGALIRAMGLEEIDWPTAVKANVKPQFAEANLLCLDAGLHTTEAGCDGQ